MWGYLKTGRFADERVRNDCGKVWGLEGQVCRDLHSVVGQRTGQRRWGFALGAAGCVYHERRAGTVRVWRVLSADVGVPQGHRVARCYENPRSAPFSRQFALFWAGEGEKRFAHAAGGGGGGSFEPLKKGEGGRWEGLS